MADDFATITGKVIKETKEAILINDGDQEQWLPKVCCEEWPKEGETGNIIAQEGILYQKGLI